MSWRAAVTKGMANTLRITRRSVISACRLDDKAEKINYTNVPVLKLIPDSIFIIPGDGERRQVPVRARESPHLFLQEYGIFNHVHRRDLEQISNMRRQLSQQDGASAV
jgi:hypothetical protein